MRMLVTVASACSVLVLPAQITVDPMPSATLCGSPTVSVSFTAAGNYNAGNVFTAELSDATGSFAAPTIIGMLSSTTSGNISCDFPAGMNGGFALRINASDPVEVGAPYVLPLMTVAPPDAGLNAVLTVCSNDPPLNLFAGLNGTPEVAGTWTSPAGAVVTGIFDPATDPSGCYTYTVAGTPPCANATAVVCITVVQAPNAGADTMLYVCSNDAPFQLVGQLAGTPSPGGTWTNQAGPFSGVFIPGVSSPGCYEYTVPGSAPCAASTATVCVSVNTLPNAGTGASVNWCQSFGDIDLFAQLTGTPQAGGTWVDLNATGALNGSIFSAAGFAPGSYAFTYTVSSPGCAPASSTVTVNVGPCLAPPGGIFPVE